MGFKLQPGPSTLCHTCEDGSIVEFGDGSTVIKCMGALGSYTYPVTVTKPVMKCSRYSHANEASVAMMKEIAWEIKISSKGGFMGFQAPKKEE